METVTDDLGVYVLDSDELEAREKQGLTQFCVESLAAQYGCTDNLIGYVESESGYFELVTTENVVFFNPDTITLI